MKDILALLIILLMALFLTTCDNITEREDLTPGSRNYTWSVDTVLTDTEYGAHNNAGRLWSASSSLWYLSQYNRELWKSNGNSWEKIEFTTYFYPTNACNLDANRFMLLSWSSYCIYNGSSFEEPKQTINSSIYSSYINDVCAVSSTNIYAAGYITENGISKAAIFHYNGSIWQLAYTGNIGRFNSIKKGSNSDFLLYFSGYNDSGMFSYDGKGLKKISWNYYYVFLLGDNVYLKDGGALYKYRDGKIFSWKTLGINSEAVVGRSESDLFYGGYGIMHYNGFDEQAIYNISGTNLKDGFTSGSDVYFLVYNNSNSQVQVIHGSNKKTL